MTQPTRFVSEDRLKAVISHLLQAVDVPPEHARHAAYILTMADLRGISSHGVRLLPGNIKRILGGAINPRPRISEAARIGALAILDGDAGMGMIVGALAMEHAIGIAREHGVGWVMVRRSNHYGASGSFVMQAIEVGMAGISISNCGPMMTVEGTVSRTIGNNPMAIGAPGPEFPVVLDMATSVASLGRIWMTRRKGEPIPDEWVLQPADATRETVLRHFGGAKGSGLAIMLEVLTSVCSGAGVPRDMRLHSPRSQADHTVHTQVAIDVSRALPREQYADAMTGLIARLRAAERAPGVEEVRLPGERAWRETLKRRREGIPLEEDIVKSLEEIAAEIGTAVPWE